MNTFLQWIVYIFLVGVAILGLYVSIKNLRDKKHDSVRKTVLIVGGFFLFIIVLGFFSSNRTFFDKLMLFDFAEDIFFR